LEINSWKLHWLKILLVETAKALVGEQTQKVIRMMGLVGNVESASAEDTTQEPVLALDAKRKLQSSRKALAAVKESASAVSAVNPDTTVLLAHK